MVTDDHPKELFKDGWAAELVDLAKLGTKALLDARVSLYDTGGRVSNHEKISEGATQAGKFLGHLKEAIGQAVSIINTHKTWLEVVPYRYRLTGVDFSGGNTIKVDFQGDYPEAENFSLFYQRGSKRWGNTLNHGDLVVRSGMSSHYLEGITDLLDVFIESNHFDNLINKDRYENASSCFDFSKISKQGDRDRLNKLLSDTTFLNLIQENKLRDVLDSYGVYQQSQAARKTDLRLKNIIAKACTFHEMPLPPGAFCKAKDTEDMGDKSGIYFGWRNSKCFYVGRSINIKNRLKSHQTISLSDDVSWLEMPDEDTHANELFYIWLLQPESNGQMKAAERSVNPPAVVHPPTFLDQLTPTPEKLAESLAGIDTGMLGINLSPIKIKLTPNKTNPPMITKPAS